MRARCSGLMSADRPTLFCSTRRVIAQTLFHQLRPKQDSSNLPVRNCAKCGKQKCYYVTVFHNNHETTNYITIFRPRAGVLDGLRKNGAASPSVQRGVHPGSEVLAERKQERV